MSILNTFLNTMEMAGNYEDRKLGRTEIGKLIVSTAWTVDCGYETAILDDNGVYPVQRYDTKGEAEKGHEKWCKEAETLKEVTMLDYPDLGVPPEKIQLKR